MKKVLLTLAVLCGIGLMAGCNNGNADENTNDTLLPANEIVSIEPPTETGYGPVWDELERLTNKIDAGDTLLSEEWSFFFEHIDTFDGYLAEGIGYALYNTLESDWYCEHMEQEGLVNLSSEKREHVLDIMMRLMSIDIMADTRTFTWDEFQIQFPVFYGSKAAEKALGEIYEWEKEDSNL